MKKTRHHFSLIVLFFLVVIIAGSYYYEKSFGGQNAPYSTQQAISYVAASNGTTAEVRGCHVRFPDKPTIILRMDDIGAFQYYHMVENLTSSILSRNMAITYGVIPRNLDKDTRLREWVAVLRENSKVEFALHGYGHTDDEFMELSREDAYARLIEGKDILTKNIGIVPITFIPPHNTYSLGTTQALHDAGFEVLSAELDEDKFDGNLTFMGWNSRSYDFENGYMVSANEVVRQCNVSLEERNLCVVMIHPQDYREYKYTQYVIPKRHKEFIKMLDGLQTLGAEFKTFKDLYSC